LQQLAPPLLSSMALVQDSLAAPSPMTV